MPQYKHTTSSWLPEYLEMLVRHTQILKDEVLAAGLAITIAEQVFGKTEHKLTMHIRLYIFICFVHLTFTPSFWN